MRASYALSGSTDSFRSDAKQMDKRRRYGGSSIDLRLPVLCTACRGQQREGSRGVPCFFASGLRRLGQNTEACKALGNSSSTGGGAIVTRRLAACVGHSFQLSEREAAKLPEAQRIEGSMLLREVDADDFPDTGPEVHRVTPESQQSP